MEKQDLLPSTPDKAAWDAQKVDPGETADTGVKS